MKIKSLKLKNYRNYDFLDLLLDDHTNIFYGDNAQGKTNILEAIYLSGTTKSHRGAKDKDLIKFGEESAHIETMIDRNGISYQVDLHLKNNGPKGVAINRMPVRKASDLFGIVNFVFFSPEDLNIIKNGPAERRKFIDMELSQLDKVYLSNLTNYKKVVAQRNHLLKDLSFHYDPILVETLDVWDAQLLQYGSVIIEKRKQFLKELGDIVSRIHGKLSGNKEELCVLYEPNVDADFAEQLRRNRDRDIKLKNTSVGPHRDDICFMIGDLDIRRFGSQGQQRTAALSLKLSEIELVKKLTNDSPILLLDDVLSELDKNRQNYLLDSIEDIQILITCTGVEDFIKNRFEVNKLFQVKEGKVTEKN